MPHIVASFDAELRNLNALVVDMGTNVGRQIDEAADAFRSRDPALAKKVVAGDTAIDALQSRIEERVIAIIAKRDRKSVV